MAKIQSIVLNNIDFTELRNQKRTLLEVITFYAENQDDDINADVTADHLTGILHMIDAIQDYAVDVLGWDEMVVFDFEDEQNRENS